LRQSAANPGPGSKLDPICRLGVSIIMMHDHAEFAWKDNDRMKGTRP
jgi:hypothetical protein